MEEIKGILCLWGVIGYFACLVTTRPKNKISALILTIALGPICWVVVLTYGLLSGRFFK